MKNIARSLIPAFAVVLVAMFATTATQAALKVQKVVSKSGVVAWLIEDHSNPIVSLSFSFRGGASRDLAGKEGTAKMISVLLDEGAGDMKALAYQRKLEDLSIRIQFKVGRDSFRGSLRTLTRNRDEAIRLLALALQKPRFDADAVERMRALQVNRYNRSIKRPAYIASRAFWSAAFPKHPYGRPLSGTEKSLKQIKASDLRNYMKANLTRDALYIGVVGDISPAQVKAMLDNVFGKLTARQSGAPISKVKPKLNGKISVTRLKTPQSVVIFGHGGLARNDKDFYAAYVLNHILGGGGFTSRLYNEVREKRGLAYSVYSYLNPLDHSALYMGSVATLNARVGASVKIIRSEWRRIAEKGVSLMELVAAKRFITGSYPLRFSSSGNIANMLSGLQQESLPIDYFEKRNGYVNAVTIEDIRRVAKRIINADGLTFIVVGDPAGL